MGNTEFTKKVAQMLEELNGMMNEDRAYVVLSVDAVDDKHQLLIALNGAQWLQTALIAELATKEDTKDLVAKALTFAIKKQIKSIFEGEPEEDTDITSILNILKTKN